ncbi:MAG: DUF3168 domain-containing protein [Paracoccus sp. (in: a-proteobacteria)]|uniref:DUF3168 domain-containing protein n=1 Tax=Paracoccus sp. TaxID=267 RepID=UPI0026DFBBE0|nr:DUF3168 domain-containing protein [Paracoccus sp. (in: a-proteobacteria)]MDO5621920.1 DUF3168 domain-containing protein [Paracoccus sp. (in: a-proteobacteria)]
MSVSVHLQAMVVARLIAAIPAVAGRVFDGSAPEAVETPYIVIGDSQVVLDDVECVEGREEYLTVHVWASSRPDRTVVRDVTSAVINAFRGWEPPEGGPLVIGQIGTDGGRIMGDPDPMFAHGVVTVRAVLEG